MQVLNNPKNIKYFLFYLHKCMSISFKKKVSLNLKYIIKVFLKLNGTGEKPKFWLIAIVKLLISKSK